MTEQHHDVIVMGIRANTELSIIKRQLAAVFKGDAQRFDFLHDLQLLDREVTFKKGLSQSAAEKLHRVLEQSGLQCRVQPSWSLQEIEQKIEMYVCPACGHEQQKAEDEADVCGQCGVIAAKYAKTLARNKLIENEKRRYEIKQNVQAHLQKEKAEHAAQQEELRKIRRRLGWQNPSPDKSLVITSLVGVFLIATGILAYALQNGRATDPSPEAEALEQTAASAFGNPPPAIESGAAITGHGTTQSIEAPKSASRDAVAQAKVAELDRLAQDQAAQGNPGAAQETFQNALDAAAAIDDNTHREEAFSAIAQHQAQSGDVSSAVESANQIDDLKLRGQTLSAITTQRSRSADEKGSQQAFEALLATADDRRAKEGIGQTNLLEFIASYALASNDIHQALEVSVAIAEPMARAEMLIKIAEKQLQLADGAGARETMGKLEGILSARHEARHQARLLSAMGRLYAGLGQAQKAKQALSRAMDSAGRIKSRADQATATSTIAKAHYRAGNKELANRLFAKATTLAGGIIVDTESRDAALHTISQDQASISEFSGSIATAAQIASAYSRAMIFKTIAQAQMGARDPASANTTFAQALRASKEIVEVELRSKALTAITDAQMAQFYGAEMAQPSTSPNRVAGEVR